MITPKDPHTNTHSLTCMYIQKELSRGVSIKSTHIGVNDTYNQVDKT